MPRHRNWWSQAGSNRRPPACKAGALPAELWPRDWSFFRLAALVVRSLGHVRVCTLPAFAHKPPCQSKKILRHGTCLPSQKIHQRSIQPKLLAILFRSRRSVATHSLLCERHSNAELDEMVGLGRFELPTSPLSGVRSNQLSYRPLVEVSGFEPLTFCLQSRRSTN